MSFQSFLTKVFLWMFLGVALTFGAGYTMFLAGWTRYLTSFPLLLLIFAIEFVIIIGLSRNIKRLNYGTMLIGFLVYSTLNGVVFSSIFAAFELNTILYAFLISALLFFMLLIIGYTTKRDLSKIGTICFAGLLALIVFQLLNYFFFKIAILELVYAYIGLLIFIGFTVYDMNMLKRVYNEGNERTENQKLAIFGALSFYLDFMNIFIYILEILGFTDR